MEAVLFMFFSTLETLAIHWLIMSLLRIPISQHLGQALLVMTLANVQSLILRNEYHLDFLVPLITLLIFLFLYSTIIKIPVIWSAVCTMIGYMLYAVIQVAYLSLIFGSVETVQTDHVDGYILQVLSAGTGLLAAWVMYKLGIGFHFNIERARLKFEHVLLIVLIAIVLVLVAILFYLNHLWLHFVFFASTFGIFLYYAIQSEERDRHVVRGNRQTDRREDQTTSTRP
ncbi:hypothetical protein [Paenibacillus lactis]|uniref:Uncharacterized protein n=1 Tax=Paenibacillus lactis 154 TaxID=743719 RepID=G4HEF1_9BACL|nr:hypothetical protein [Paenibacillus lactis]EHB65220.1 hypothetical protein PaelaDRAFT_2362 [Paenibacillus lactis 154]